MRGEDGLSRARACFERHAWQEAHDLLVRRDAEATLDVSDLERLAVAAFLVGDDARSDGCWTRAFQHHSRSGDVAGAVRSAFWLAFRLLNAGQHPDANGWIGRLERLVAGDPHDSADHGRLAYLTGLRAVLSGDLVCAATDLGRALEIAERGDDPDVATLARLALGRTLIFRDDVPAGVRLLDEAMVVVAGEEVSPFVVGDSCCTAIEACRDVFDVQRGQRWTALLSRWCDSRPDLVPYAGLCLVHRSELLQLTGAWTDAVAHAESARQRLSTPAGQVALGAATYQQGELHRLRGELDEADECYRRASGQGRDPQPGLARLRLGQGRADAAARGIRRALAEADGPVARRSLLAAYVEVMVAVGELDAARQGCEELAAAAQALGSTMLDAVAERARCEVELADGHAAAALAPLRRAAEGFRSQGASYDVARTGILIARARRALGDEEGALLELEASRRVLADLGAGADLLALDRSSRSRTTRGDSPLTAREREVLRLVARGETNRAIGATLGLSERTIDRHLSNVFAKLGVSSRAAATASAYERQLL